MPVIVKDDYLKIKESWVCNMCVDDDNKINQALGSVAPSTAHTTGKPAAATSSLSTDGTDKASGVTLSDILNEMISFRKEKKNLNSRDLGFNTGDGHVIYVNDTLTRERRQLLRAAREVKKSKQYAYLWVKNGRIFLRKMRAIGM
ncbi:hypothetical protein J6590_032351 [Homalodisca vitripennis]|nr:hypothetical protein J6590_032351 [Homalodisca vitripennis]